jgi:hypothetical protein
MKTLLILVLLGSTAAAVYFWYDFREWRAAGGLGREARLFMGLPLYAGSSRRGLLTLVGFWVAVTFWLIAIAVLAASWMDSTPSSHVSL